MFENHLNIRVALVTGANRGIGFESCRQFALEGFTVILTARSPEKGQKAVRKLQEENLKVNFCQLDVTDPESIRLAVEFVQNEYGRLDVLVNNAGISLDEGKRFTDISPDILQETLDVNLLGVFRVTHAFLPFMKKKGFGRIINISSGLGSFASLSGGTGAYKLSKYALNGMTRIMADEVRGGDIRINALNPGWVQTDMGGRHAPRTPTQAARSIVQLALQHRDGPNGEFIKDNQVIRF
jgi:NAD(P)-dependent dehydrogenase (short-subunit alcohol dehydrogenase family)